jgi:hypothetical protein
VSRREPITKELLVEPGTDANIAGRDSAWIGWMDLSWPEVSEQARIANAEARRKLAAEPEDETG